MTDVPKLPHVVIIGGGFAGLDAARALKQEFDNIDPASSRILLNRGGPVDPADLPRPRVPHVHRLLLAAAPAWSPVVEI
jgi:monoamine oxidase